MLYAKNERAPGRETEGSSSSRMKTLENQRSSSTPLARPKQAPTRRWRQSEDPPAPDVVSYTADNPDRFDLEAAYDQVDYCPYIKKWAAFQDASIEIGFFDTRAEACAALDATFEERSAAKRRFVNKVYKMVESAR
jgi:hypothetical protein